MDLIGIERHRRTVTSRYGVTSYLDIGTGPPAVFVHGLATSAYLWRNVIPRLADQRRCLAPDLPVHGRTPGSPDQDFSLNGLATFVEDFCTALELPPADLVANDTGGAIAQVFAARRPERLATLTLTNARPTTTSRPRSCYRPCCSPAWACSPRSGGCCYATSRATESASTVPGSKYGTAANGRQFQRLLRSLHARDLLAVEDRLERLMVPTLIVWGTGDRFFPTKWAYWLRDTIPAADTVIELPAARLFFPDERADELAAAITPHWAGSQTASAHPRLPLRRSA